MDSAPLLQHLRRKAPVYKLREGDGSVKVLIPLLCPLLLSQHLASQSARGKLKEASLFGSPRFHYNLISVTVSTGAVCHSLVVDFCIFFLDEVSVHGLKTKHLQLNSFYVQMCTTYTPKEMWKQQKWEDWEEYKNLTLTDG